MSQSLRVSACRVPVAVAAIAALWLSSLVFAQQAPSSDRKIWDGVYTAAQAARGKERFERTCARCHNNALIGSERGPAIKGNAFWSKWENDSLGSLFTLLRDTMPQDGAGVLADDIKIDILAYILQVSGVPAGESELKLDIKGLEAIKIARKTVTDGIFSTAQAVRGKAAFEKEGCSSCHQIDLSGNRAPALKGNEFLTHWENGSVNSLFAKIRDTMPPNGPADVTPETKIDIVSYLLEANGFPAGRVELKSDTALLENVDIIRRGGGTGVPNFSLVQAVGCLTPGPKTSWLLKRSSEPAATRDEEPTPQLLTAAQTKPLGTLDVLLVSAAGFKPSEQSGKKVEARGLLYRDNGETRINLTSLQPTGASCN